MTVRTGGAARIDLAGQDCKDKTARAERNGENSQKRTARTGQLEQDSQSGAVSMR
jgi:hypothetical protein